MSSLNRVLNRLSSFGSLIQSVNCSPKKTASTAFKHDTRRFLYTLINGKFNLSRRQKRYIAIYNNLNNTIQSNDMNSNRNNESTKSNYFTNTSERIETTVLARQFISTLTLTERAILKEELVLAEKDLLNATASKEAVKVTWAQLFSGK